MLARTTAEAVARRSYGKLVAFLAARTGNVAAAEDALSEAFASALSDWPLDDSGAGPHLHVCGEAYSDYQGFIEGALNSAELALQTIAPHMDAEPESEG